MNGREKAYCERCDKIVKVIRKMGGTICGSCRVILPQSAFSLKHFLPDPIDYGKIELICDENGNKRDASYHEFSAEIIAHAKIHGFHYLKKTNKIFKGCWVSVNGKRYRLKNDKDVKDPILG